MEKDKDLTREVLEAMAGCTIDKRCSDCAGVDFCNGRNKNDISRAREKLARALLAEMDKPKVWDGAPEWANEAWPIWRDKSNNAQAGISYFRDLPKTRAREIAEEATGDYENSWSHPLINGKRAVDVVESAILKALAEKEATK